MDRHNKCIRSGLGLKWLNDVFVVNFLTTCLDYLAVDLMTDLCYSFAISVEFYF